MRRLDRSSRIRRAKHFSQAETALLSGFSRDRLAMLEEAELILPITKDPIILYSWNQLVFLRVLFFFREESSFQDLQRFINSMGEKELNDLIKNTAESIAVLFTKTKQQTPEVRLMSELPTKATNKLQKAIHALLNAQQLSYEDVAELVHYMDRDYFTSSPTKFHLKSATFLAIPAIKKELKELSDSLHIQDFDIKVSNWLRI